MHKKFYDFKVKRKLNSLFTIFVLIPSLILSVFSLILFIVGDNFCLLPNISSLLRDEIDTDKVLSRKVLSQIFERVLTTFVVLIVNFACIRKIRKISEKYFSGSE